MIIVLLATVSASAFDFTSYADGIDESNIFINAGVGYNVFSDYATKIPPINLSADFQLPGNQPITLGVQGAFSMYDNSYTADYFSYNYAFTYITLAARAAWHVDLLANLDLYLGLQLGWEIQSYIYTHDYDENYGTDYTSDWSGGIFTYGAFLGARYFFTDVFGAWLEIGYSSFQLGAAGLSLKF
ncbi:MAG: hypothetical protein LBV20_00410 [Treponema sp.]|nr:hypothetical protein [Treponema sp.]